MTKVSAKTNYIACAASKRVWNNAEVKGRSRQDSPLFREDHFLEYASGLCQATIAYSTASARRLAGWQYGFSILELVLCATYVQRTTTNNNRNKEQQITRNQWWNSRANAATWQRGRDGVQIPRDGIASLDRAKTSDHHAKKTNLNRIRSLEVQ